MINHVWNTAESNKATESGSAEESKETPFVVKQFEKQLEDPDLPIQVAAIRALTTLIRETSERTAQGLLIELRAAADQLQQCPISMLRGKTSISVAAGCELLVRHVTRTSKFDHTVCLSYSQNHCVCYLSRV